ncbi:hypothetical protein BDV98DRAFT_568108 [Pterulicium gracile]|uniref:Anti-proliferative protein domain-containing protein n=1 Tax=Pterulicium gracile TaxID=1884261 RepID=A0A5C3QMJ8_9AGAR|nr:hypothetical protein BDV98DRAFT_568108 [Pterula gracilis]
MSFSTAINHAIAFLTLPLIQATPAPYPTRTVQALQNALFTSLSASLASGRKFFTLNPRTVPPKPVYTACLAAGVQWARWISLLTDREVDLIIDAGKVEIRVEGQAVTVWEDTTRNLWNTQPSRVEAPRGKTLAQLVIEADEDEEEEIFAMLAARMNVPIVSPTPTRDTFTIDPIPTQEPISRSSSRSSCTTASDCSTSPSSCSSSPFFVSKHLSSSSSSSESDLESNESKPRKRSVISRRERARLARVFIDTSRVQPTDYDSGRTGVLTGGVMLGGGKTTSSAKPRVTPTATANSWRRS